MEAAANAAFEAYREQYYEGGASSVYSWKTPTGFATAVAIRKVFQQHKKEFHRRILPTLKRIIVYWYIFSFSEEPMHDKWCHVAQPC
jgi:hypothetical protein